MNALRGEQSPGIASSAARIAPRLATTCLDEGLARLEYLTAEKRRVGLIVGPAGSGKSYLARQFARSARRQACDVALVDLIAVDSRELLWNLVSQLGVRRTARETRFALWRAFSDRLIENRFERRPIVLFLDGIDQASLDSIETILRMLHLAESEALALTCVLIARTDRFHRIDPRLQEQIELRIEMEPWDAREISGYVSQRFETLSLAGEGIEPTAIEELQRLTGGEPRDVAHLTELAAVVQQDQREQPLDGPTMVAVFEELSGLGLGAPQNM